MSVLGSIIQGAGGIASNLIGGLFSRKNTKDTNAQNLKIAQMNNEWSERMMDKQNLMNVAQWQRESDFSRQQMESANAFTEKMWQKQADYNSAAAQVKRLKEAGLNPALAMGSQNAGSVSSAQGAQGATPSGNSVGLPSPVTATMQTDNFGQYLSRGVETAAMLIRNSAETQSILAQTDALKAKTASDLAKQAEETRNLKFKNKLNEITENLQYSLMNEQFLSAVNQRLTQEQQLRIYKQTELMNNKELAAFDERLRMDIAVMGSQIDLNKSNSQHDVGKIIDTLEKRGYKLSNYQKQTIFDALLWSVSTFKTNGLTDLVTRGLTSGKFIKGQMSK